LFRGSTGVPLLLLLASKMKEMIGDCFHASGWRGQHRFSNTLAFCLKKASYPVSEK
jgi:hypothetical protein